MSDVVTLTLRAPLDEWIDGRSIVPDRFATLSEPQIASLPVFAGRQQRSLADYFAISGSQSSRVRVVDDVRRVSEIGSAMTTGELVIDGPVGARLGVAMAGGSIDALSDVGDDLGVAMSGGSIRVRGNAGLRVGAALPGASRGMLGGEIVVDGSVRDDAGARMRRGLLFVGGTTGNRVARAIIAGTVIVVGRTGSEPGYASKRGTLIAMGGVDVPETYRYACRYEPPHVRLTLTYISRRYRIAIDPRFVHGRYHRYCGDAGTVAKGEILEWTSD